MIEILPGWEFRDGIWNGPFPFEGYDNSVRMCMTCGIHIRECMGSVMVGDILPTMQGKPFLRFPREQCFMCATGYNRVEKPADGAAT